MLRLFCGYDPREALGFSAFVHSVILNSPKNIAVVPIHGSRRDGTTDFTYSRFMVPYLCGYKGWAVFADGSDMMLRTDLNSILAHCDESKAVYVVKHDYQTTNNRKYLGTEMEAANEDYPRKNWSSLIVWNCSHQNHKYLTPNMISATRGRWLHNFSWLTDELVGSLPLEWNHLVREYEPNPDAKLVHFTLGIPGFAEYSKDEFSDEWRSYLNGVRNGSVIDEQAKIAA